MLRPLLIFSLLNGSLFAAEPAAHWAYRKPLIPPRPPVREIAWPRGELDYLALAPIENAGLAPSAEAEPATLLRRVSLDLTGLPPTPEEVAASVADASEAAYEAAVDRLLASPRFGERWASVWLDLARYADTQGYEKDNLRTTWAYRDWVIKAFNDDLPLDRFTIEQLAGDLLPAPTVDQLIATAFHRQTMTNTEGGTDDEEFRVKAVIDRVNTTATVWLGLSVACAQCHDHPNEALAQREYYGLMAFFNNTADADKNDDAPVLSVVPLTERAHAAEEAAAESLVPIMRELAGAERRVTRRFHRGNFLDQREEVSAATPALLHAFPPGAPRNRLGLAQWVVSPENPLTARVLVNRVWARLFGMGIVETEEDFGTTGSRPSNQALLDDLAVRFQGDMHWSLKKLLREIVLSATYRQRSAGSEELRARDPQNRLLARGGRFRLPAETLRDQALAAAGLLSEKMYGRSVMPPQPDGVWSVVYNAQRWVTSRGEDRYRRALYTFTRRTSPYPSAALFDAPPREICTPRRVRTNTPSAALVTLNDPVFVEAAAALGKRMAGHPGGIEEEVRFGWKLLLAREPSEFAVRELGALWAKGGAGAVGTALLNLDETLTHE